MVLFSILNKGKVDIVAEHYTKFIDAVEEMFQVIRKTQDENIKKAGEIIAKSIMSGGIMHAFGSGHSHAVAIEICSRAGGLLQARAIKEPAGGIYETVEGVGVIVCNKLDLESNDCFVLISNSGRNPLIIEIALWVKKRGIPLIGITSLDASKSMTSRHSSGKRLFEIADVVLDNKGVYGDACMELPGMSEKVLSTSSFTSMLLADCSVFHSMKIMLDQGFEPPVAVSKNIDGDFERIEKIRSQFKKRLGYY